MGFKLGAPVLKTRASGIAGLIFFAVFWWIILSVFIGFVVHAVARSADARRRYAETTGRVVSTAIHESPGDSDSGPTYKPVIGYAYQVGRIAYTNDRYDFFSVSSGRGWAESVMREYPAGKEVAVYYDPDKPYEAVLHRDLPAMTYFLILFLQPFLVVGLGLVGYLIAWPSRKRRLKAFVELPDGATPAFVPLWGRVAAEFGGLTVRPAVGPSPILLAFAGGYGLTCFLGIFIVGFAFGGFGGARPAAVTAVLFLAPVVGVLASVGSVFGAGRKAVLQVDVNHKLLRLTSPRRQTEVRFDNIAGWFCRQVRDPQRSSSKSETTWLFIVGATTAAGGELPVRVLRGLDVEEARRVAEKAAAWLARLTGRPLLPPEAELPPQPELSLAGLKAALAEARRQQAAFKSLQDLM